MWPDAFEALRRAAETVREEWGSARATAAAATEGETGVLAVAAPKFSTRAVAAALEVRSSFFCLFCSSLVFISFVCFVSHAFVFSS
jgi:hypothetical protein